MNINKIAIVAILLWVATIAVFAWFFVHGNTEKSRDQRTAIVLGAGERELILSEMRGLLLGVHNVLDGINKNDPGEIAQAARAVGMTAAADVNPALMAKLPLDFKQLGMSVHQAMDELAQAAESRKPRPELQTALSNVLSKCVACHAAWKLKAE